VQRILILLNLFKCWNWLKNKKVTNSPSQGLKYLLVLDAGNFSLYIYP